MFLAAMESLVGSTVLPSVISSLGGIDLYLGWSAVFYLQSCHDSSFWKACRSMGFARVYFIATIFFAIGSLHCGAFTHNA